jgi:uncharacterized NAD(P)/FAD-binding protein YdhS
LRKGFNGPIDIVEPREQLGRGLAYSTPYDQHLLNVPAERMSALPDSPSHFLDWLRKRGCPATASGFFATRKLYGEYLVELLQEEASQASRNNQVNHLRGDVTGIDVLDDAASVQLADGATIQAARVVLAIGNPASSPTLNVAASGADEICHPSPWLGDALTLRFPSERILLLGTGLTAIDSMLAFLGQGEQSEVYMISRRGILPQVHSVCPSPTPPPPLRNRHQVRLILAEVRKNVQAAADADECWRASIDGLRAQSNRIWTDLPLAERERFLRHLKAYWEPHRHRMAPAIGKLTAQYRAAGRLRVLSARLQRMRRVGDRIEVCVASRTAGQPHLLEVDRVINCTGLHESYDSNPRPLIQDLIAKGHARAHPLGMGFHTDDGGALLDSAASPSRLLFTLGPPRRGQLFETTAVPEIRSQAERLAERLIDSLNASISNTKTNLTAYS